MRFVVALVGLPLVLVAGGCGSGGSGSAAGGGEGRWESFHQRAGEVAEAWRPGPEWSSGYVPLQDPTVPLGDPGFTPETEQAFRNGWYRERIDVPGAAPADATIRFPAGALSVPLVSAATAYRQLDRGDPPPCAGRPPAPTPENRPSVRPRNKSTDGPIVEPGPDGPIVSPKPEGPIGGPGPVVPTVGPGQTAGSGQAPGAGPTVEPGPDGPTSTPNPPSPPSAEGPAGPTVEPGPDGPSTSAAQAACVSLTVTAVRLGTAPVRTSRGMAQVPAWVFTVAELTAPVARLAVAPGAVTAVPRGTAPTGPVPDTAAPTGPVPDAVVGAQDVQAVNGAELTFRIGVGACDTAITPLVREDDKVVVVGGGVTRATGICTDQLLIKPVTATLQRPLGDRPVLDVATGTPLIVRP
ncbi:hypothetical protein [Micromonospora sp. DT233]|uniref:hypothetical protein n=1 Tax=Micromonospora sp. DT233 TaxID=3393432 RepID=UPI003CF238C7